MPWSYERVVRKNCIDQITLKNIVAQYVPQDSYETMSHEEMLVWFWHNHCMSIVHHHIAKAMAQSKE